jgi:hypothetical protein
MPDSAAQVAIGGINIVFFGVEASDQYQSLFATPLAIFRFLDENRHNN